MPRFQQRIYRKSKPRWTILGRNLLPRKFCSVFSHAFGSKPWPQQGFSSNQSAEVQMMKSASMGRELVSDHDGEYRGGGSSSFSSARGRAFKISRIRCKWSKKRNAERDENAERSKQLASRFSALFGLGKKDNGYGVKTWKISPGTSEDSSFAAVGLTGHREIQSPEFSRKTAGMDEEEEGLELCKKRILMGEKCRALNSSGSLHYDHNGVLLPEFLPYES